MATTNRMNGFLIFVNLILVILYLLCCLIPFVSSGIDWLLTLIGLGFPYFLFALILFCFVYLFLWRRKNAKVFLVVNLVVIFLGFQQIRASIGFHFFANRDAIQRPEGIRFMSWNVSKLDISNWDLKNGKTFQPLMYDVIEQMSPDVICLQEFFNITQHATVPSYVKLLQQKGFQYYFFVPTELQVNNTFQSGIAIFSKYPISDTAFFNPYNAGHSEGYMYADITIRNKTFRVFNASLESTGMTTEDAGALKKGEGSRSFLQKLKYTGSIRDMQAEALKKSMNESPHPVVFAGDLNSVPNSEVYFLLRNGLQDAFIKKGSGFGRTFRFIAPHLRIDYLFFDRSLSVKQFNVIHNNYSDHYPVIADISE